MGEFKEHLAHCFMPDKAKCIAEAQAKAAKWQLQQATLEHKHLKEVAVSDVLILYYPGALFQIAWSYHQ